MKNDNKFEQIVNNALEYLTKSIKNLDNDPKASVIFYFSGLELLFKARLMYEHWSFILEDIDDKKISYKKFSDGDFISVGLNIAAQRIRNLFKDLDEGYENHFDKLSNTRNKLIHFDHFSKKDKDLSIDAISESWYYLFELLNKKWNRIFSKYQDKIDNLYLDFKKYSTHFYTSKQKALIKENEAKYKNNPDYKIVEIEKKPLTCNICNCSYSKENKLSLLQTVYNKEDFSLEVKCDVCENKEIIKLSSLYILNSDIPEKAQTECEHSANFYLENGDFKHYILTKTGLDTDNIKVNIDAGVFNYKTYLDEEDATLERIDDGNCKLVLDYYLDFKVEAFDNDNELPITAFYFFIVCIELKINKKIDNVKFLNFQELYNDIIQSSVHIKRVDSDGF